MSQFRTGGGGFRVCDSQRLVSIFGRAATQQPLAAYHRALKEAAAYADAPRGQRMRATALRRYQQATADAAALFDATAEEIMREGGPTARCAVRAPRLPRLAASTIPKR